MGTGNREFVDYVMELFAPLGDAHSERFFGGLALKSSGALFAMIMDGTLYFAVDDALRPEYEKLGSRCFSYATKKGRVDVKRFFEAPVDAFDDQERLLVLAKSSVAAAQRIAVARASKPRAKRKPAVPSTTPKKSARPGKRIR